MATGIGTTSVSKATDEESSLIKSSIGLTRGEINSKGIIESLKEDREQKIKQREATKDILLLTDVTIDGYDRLIVNMDKPLPGLIQEINDKIDDVKDSYDVRIQNGCLSDLKWIKTGEVTRTLSFPYKTSPSSTVVTYQYWEVKKDPDQYRKINYYGAKYYKRPHNRDYGANIIVEIPDASVGVGSTFIVVYNSDFQSISGIITGDTITDSLENPTIFQIGNLPEIVGFGSTSILGFSTTFGGDISLGSTILKHTGSGIVTSGISIGDLIVRVGITSSDTVVVGFGTADAAIEIVDDEGQVGIITSLVNTLILSKPAIASTTLGEFGVGIITSYPTLFISTTTPSGGERTNFIVIRQDEDVDESFNYLINGSDPIEIGLIKNQSKVGYGHTIQIINNGDPDVIRNWREVIDPEPPVGGGFASYYVGASSWPGQYIPILGGIGGTSIVGYAFTYRPEGYKIVIGLGLTTPQPSIASTSTKPPGAADNATCNTYTANIATAESELSATISKNVPKLNYYANSSDVLRDVRDDKENLAWSMRRGTGFLTEEINKLTDQIAVLEDIDFREFE
jgi:hypothetical protein